MNGHRIVLPPEWRGKASGYSLEGIKASVRHWADRSGISSLDDACTLLEQFVEAPADGVEPSTAVPVPHGWALVPVDPPDLLLNSFLSGYGARGGSFNAGHLRDRARRGYEAMLGAVPVAVERGIFKLPTLGEVPK